MKALLRLSLALIFSALLASGQALPKPNLHKATSFRDVGKYLTPGGSFYVYMDTDQWGEKLVAFIDQLGSTLANAGPAGQNRESTQVVFQLLGNLVDDSGLKAVSGVGMSSVMEGENLYQNRAVIAHEMPGPPTGLYWESLVAQNAPMEFVHSVPNDTVMAVWGPANPAPLWRWLTKSISDSGHEPMIEGFNQAINTARAQGIDLDQWIESIGPNMGVVITASREENAVIPLPTGVALEVPQAAVALVFEVHDDAIFTYLDNMTQQMPNVLRMGFDDVTMRSIQIPVPVPIRVQPTYAKMGKYLVLASNGEILKAMNACAKGRAPSIETDEEFLKLSADMPTEGLGFSFLSQRFGQIMTGITQSAMAADPGGLEMSRLFNTMEGQAAYSVTVRMPDALVGVSRSTYNVGETVVIQCAAIPVVMAGMLLPAMTQARGKARNISDMGNLKQIALGVMMYQADHNDMLPNDLGDIWDYVGDGRVFICPAGNTQPPTSADEIRAGKCDYLYFTKGKKLTEVKNPSQTPMACTKPGMLKQGVNVAFCDGHVEMKAVLDEELKTLIRAAGHPLP